MYIKWYYKEEIIDNIPDSIMFYVDDDIFVGDGYCTIIFNSFDDAINTIKILYPTATFKINIDLNYKNAYIEDFDNHLYEKKAFREFLERRRSLDSN